MPTRLGRGLFARLLACLVGVCSLSVPALAQEPEKRSPDMECAIRLRNLSIGAFVYASKHGGKLPADLYTALTLLAENEGKTGVQAVGDYARTNVVSPAHAGLLIPPKDIDAAWVNEHSSYRYLGNAEVNEADVQESGRLVIAHLRLDRGHEAPITPDNPEGQVFTLAFLDGHVEVCNRATAERLINESAAVFDAMRTGAPAPPDRQATLNLGMILRAIHAYAKAHDGKLPPDLGATLEYIPSNTKQTATPQQRARVFISPRSTGSVPDAPTPEWVNANCWYVYLGSPELALADIPEGNRIVLVHARLDDPFRVSSINDARVEMVPVGLVHGAAELRTKECADWIVRESMTTYHSMRTGEPLPDWVHAAHDIRRLSAAIGAYAKSHDGFLPGSQADLVDSLPEALRARPADVARLFLSPRAERITEIPAAPTREWILANADYVYLGTATAKNERQPGGIGWAVLVHSPPDQTYRLKIWSGGTETVVCGDGYGSSGLVEKDWALVHIAECARELRALPPTPEP